MKTSKVLISIAFLAMTSTAIAGVFPNGWSNGVSENGINGNGITANGVGVHDASSPRPAIVLSGVRGNATTTDHQVHLTGIRLKKH